jgi:feruloyl-CoA synthase
MFETTIKNLYEVSPIVLRLGPDRLLGMLAEAMESDPVLRPSVLQEPAIACGYGGATLSSNDVSDDRMQALAVAETGFSASR